MFGFPQHRNRAARILAMIHDFEMFCMGTKNFSPAQYRSINEDLSIGAVLHIGKCRFESREDGRHVIWSAPDLRDYDLGAIDQLNVMRDYPGFHRTHSLALGHDKVADAHLMVVPRLRRNVTVVTMKDGTVGIGPNYRVALRNAALKMHLTRAFEEASLNAFWKRLHGQA